MATSVIREQLGSSRSYVLFILLLIGAANIGDRMILSMMLDPVGAEFHVSDAALGLLAGSAFAILYAGASIPVGVLSDRFSRRIIVAIGAIVFGSMTISCGLAVRFWQLVVARAIMSVGEAVTESPSYSIISDLYPPERRATAIAVFQAGGSLGLLITLSVGGLLLQYFGWRMAFFAAGLPSVVLAMLLLSTVREPTRGAADGVKAEQAHAVTVVARFLAGQTALIFTIGGVAIAGMGAYGIASFLPAFFVRSHHLTASAVGVVAALLFGVAGGAGLVCAGVLADRLTKDDIRWNLWLPALSLIVGGALLPVLLLAPSLSLALIAAVPAIFLLNMFFGPTYSLVQSLVPIRMRATAVALLLFVLNLVGAGLGPPLVGWMSDLLRPVAGTDALRWSLVLMSGGNFLASACFAIAARLLPADVQRLRGFELLGERG